MVITKIQQRNKLNNKPKLAKASPIPIIPATEMTTSVSDHNRNVSLLVPIEQKLLQDILTELKALHNTLKNR